MMLRKGDKTPFTIRTILVMLAVYLCLMLAATWCVKESFESGIDANEIWEEKTICSDCFLPWCAGHGTILAGESPATGIYRQV